MRTFLLLIFCIVTVTTVFSQPPPCGNNPPAGNTCLQATPICDLNGYCGNTSSSYTVNAWGTEETLFGCGLLGFFPCPGTGLLGAFCGSIENNSFISFVAQASTVSLEVWVFNSTTGSGIQIMVFSSAGNCSGNVTTHYCNGQFLPSNNAQSITINGLTPGNTYYVMIDGFAGDVCDYVFAASGNSGISVPVDITPDTQTICEGASATLTASGGNGIYTWNVTPQLNATNTAVVVATPPSVPGTYTYTVNSVSGNTNCPSASVATATVVVESCGCPLTTTNSGPVCADATFNLTASSTGTASNYQWTGPNGYTSSVQNPTGVIPPGTPGTYTYTVTATVNGSPCSSSTTVTVNDCTVGCDIDLIRQTFTAAGCIELASCVRDCSLYFLNPQTMTGSQAQAFAQTHGANLVSIQSMEENQCVLSALNNIGQTGTIWIGFNDEAVEGQFVWYDQSPVGFTNWAPGEPNNSGGNEDCVQIYPGGASPGTWNDLSCTSANSKSIIEVNTCPVINAGPDITICLGETAPLNASATLFGSNPYTYSWSNGPTTLTNPVSPATTTQYVVSTLDRYNCYAKDTVIVTVNPIPVVNAGPDQAVCSGAQVTLNGTGGTPSWNNGVTNGVPFTATTTTTYTYTGMLNGCSVTDDVVVTVSPEPVVNFVPDVITGCAPLTVNFINQTTPGGGAFVWDFGDGNTSVATASATNIYNSAGCFDVSLTATTPDGCVKQVSYPQLICVVDRPVAAFVPTPAELSLSNSFAVMDNHSTNASSYIWNFGDGSPISTAYAPGHAFPDHDAGSYQVVLIAISDQGCRDTVRVNIRVEDELIYYVPNAFTPDADEFNPVFKPVFTVGFDPLDYKMTIYNRWGELIFESHDVNYGWDGTYSGSRGLTQDGAYTWKIEFKTTKSDERKMVIGNVNLLR